MAKHNTGKKRNSRQKLKARYSKAREDAQLAGLIETTPEEAVGNERVDPATQGDAPIPGLVGRAVRRGWATPEHRKPRIIDELIGLVEAPGEDVDPHVKVSAARVLQQADKDQWERDNPELAGKTRGGGARVDVSVNNQVNLFEKMLEAASQPVVTVEQELEQRFADSVVGSNPTQDTDGHPAATE